MKGGGRSHPAAGARKRLCCALGGLNRSVPRGTLGVERRAGDGGWRIQLARRWRLQGGGPPNAPPFCRPVDRGPGCSLPSPALLSPSPAYRRGAKEQDRALHVAPHCPFAITPPLPKSYESLKQTNTQRLLALPRGRAASSSSQPRARARELSSAAQRSPPT